jgi:hypothetical protein
VCDDPNLNDQKNDDNDVQQQITETEKKENTLYESVTSEAPLLGVLETEGPTKSSRTPKLTSCDYCCLLHTTSTVQNGPNDLLLTTSNFIDSGATINAVSLEFCSRASLEDKIEDHGETMLITLANKQEMNVPRKTVHLNLFIDDFEPYEGDFLVLSVPEKQDILLGMPWLKTVNPAIDWIEEKITPRVVNDTEQLQQQRKVSKKKKAVKPRTTAKPSQPALHVGGRRFSVSGTTKHSYSRDFSEGYYSVASGETKLSPTSSSKDCSENLRILSVCL